MKRLANDAGVPIFATWHARYASKVSEAAAWCRIHSLHSGRIDWFEDARKWHPGQVWLWKEGGFGVFDPGINALSILSALHSADWRISEPSFDVPSNVEMPISAKFTLIAGDALIETKFDFRPTAVDTWSIHLESIEGARMDLTEGGSALSIDGGVVSRGQQQEYTALYERFAGLVRSGESEFDVIPLQLAEDAFANAKTCIVGPITI